VVTRFVAIDIILPEELDCFRKDGNLRVTAVVIGRSVGRIEANSEENIEKNETREGAEQKAAFHGKSSCLAATMIVHAEIFGNAQSVG
jgi:hypothetical protein